MPGLFSDLFGTSGDLDADIDPTISTDLDGDADVDQQSTSSDGPDGSSDAVALGVVADGGAAVEVGLGTELEGSYETEDGESGAWSTSNDAALDLSTDTLLGGSGSYEAESLDN